jgi:hypothetical protein
VAKVSVLYIKDDVVAPHLELMRNICEPTSKAKPHVTVRFFNKLAIPADYIRATANHVDMLAPGAYLNSLSIRDNRTVFIRCQADDLLSLEHKPLFPTSEFHITVYDGSSDYFARKLFEILSKYRWAFRLELPKASSLTTIEIKPKGARRVVAKMSREYAPNVVRLYREIFSKDLNENEILSLSENVRLEIVDKICAHLHRLVINYERVKAPKQLDIAGFDRFPEEKYDIHLTPPELAQDIAEYASNFLNGGEINFGDPAVGTGVFYAAVLKVVGRDAIKSAVGIDISVKQVEAARWRWKNKDMEVTESDFLRMRNKASRNLILANPPYLRHQRIPSAYKQELRERASVELGMRVSARSGLYVYFVIFCHTWMVPGAIAAWLIPSEFMQTDYGKALRRYLSEKVQLLRIHQFDAANPQFENAEVLPCVVVFKNEKPLPNHQAIFSKGGTLVNPIDVEKIRIAELDKNAKWTISKPIIIERNENFVKLGDLFSVRRGIATGANDFFIMERKRATELGIPEIALKPLLPKAMSLDSDVILRKRDGNPKIKNQMCVIDCSLPESDIEIKYPDFMKFLKKGKSDGVLNGYLVSRRSPWYKQEQRDPAPFLCTYMGKAHGDKPAIRFIWNKSNAIATNTYLLLYPHPALKELLKKNNEFYLLIFNILKDSSWNSINEFTRSHAGGLSKIEPKELEEVWLGPLPEALIAVANKRLF